MEKGTKKFLALVSFAGLASSMGVTSGVYAAETKLTQQGGAQGTANPKGNAGAQQPGTGNNPVNVGKPGDPVDKKELGGASNGAQNDSANKEMGQGNTDTKNIGEEAAEREKKKAEGKVENKYDVYYQLNSDKTFTDAYNRFLEKVKFGDKDFYKKKGDLKDSEVAEADKALNDSFTPYYFGKDLNEVVTVNGFSKRNTAIIAGGAALVAAGTALAIREYMAGSSAGEDSE